MPSSLEEEKEEEEIHYVRTGSIQPTKAYEDESVMLSGPHVDNGQHKEEEEEIHNVHTASKGI